MNKCQFRSGSLLITALLYFIFSTTLLNIRTNPTEPINSNGSKKLIHDLVLNQSSADSIASTLQRLLNTSTLPTSAQIDWNDPDFVSADSQCTFQGKVFVLGSCKRGTTTMTNILQNDLNYTTSAHTWSYHPLWNYFQSDSWFALSTAVDDLSWVSQSPFCVDKFLKAIQRSNVFADSPWNYLQSVY